MGNEKLIKKLQIKPGSRLLLLNAPQSFLAALPPLPEGLTMAKTMRDDRIRCCKKRNGTLKERRLQPCLLKSGSRCSLEHLGGHFTSPQKGSIQSRCMAIIGTGWFLQTIH